MRDSITRWLREPLVHFILAGACIYGLYAAFAPGEGGGDERTIVVTAGEIAWIEESWNKRWNRMPTPLEREGLIQQYVEETALYREALAMGLDADDTIIRRRLAQKLKFLSQDLLQPEAPSEEEIRSHFEANQDRYRSPDLLTLSHVFLDPDQRDETTLRDAEALKAELVAQGEPAADARLGDPFMLQSYYPQRSEAELSKLFGSEFARSVAELEPQQWHGPVLSGYGVHLVYVHDRVVAEPVTFAQAEARVREDWESQRREQLNRDFIAGVLARYEVIAEGETPVEAPAKLAERSQ